MIIKDINSFKNLMEILSDFRNDNRLIFRGQSKSDWGLLSTIGREHYYKNIRNSYNEKLIFNSWKRYAIYYLKNELNNDWDWLTLAQHHGLATRLLDWTKNPLNAVYFAVEENPEYDGALFILKTDFGVIDDFTISPFEITETKLLFPKGISSRIVHQRGLFTISHIPNKPLELDLGDSLYKFLIKKDAKREISEHLFFFGINRLNIFQDLDSLSDTINYYVLNRWPLSTINTLLE